MKPSLDNDISDLPKGYKGFKNHGVAYDPFGRKLSLPAVVDVYESKWANSRPYFFTKLIGLEGSTIAFYITVYTESGAIYKNSAGQKCIYKVLEDTPKSAAEYGNVAPYSVEHDVHLAPFSKITLKYVLSAKDVKTGASIPIKGEKNVSAWFKRDW